MERPIVPALAPMSLAIENTLLRSAAAASLRSIGFQEGGEFLDGTQDARTAGLGRSKDIGVFRVGISNIGWTMRKLVEIGRAHVCTQVTNAQLVCRLRLEKTRTN